MVPNVDLTFRYDPAILEQFPSIWGGVILARGLKNGSTPRELMDEFQTEQKHVLSEVGEDALAEIASIEGWRRAFAKFGVKPTQYRSAVEALLRRLTKKGDIPNINMLVDLGNLVSIRYRLPVAIFDTRATTGAVTVRFARGDELFTPLGVEEIEHPEPNEVIFVDEANLVSARRWCWRQSDQSAATESTTTAIITVEGHHTKAESDVRVALLDLMVLLRKYSGESAKFQSGLLSTSTPEIKWLPSTSSG